MMVVNRLRASLSTIKSFNSKKNNEARQALLYEIYHFQLHALATITNREDLLALIAHFIHQQNELERIFLEIDVLPFLNKIALLKTQQAFYQWMLLISLVLLFHSLLLILFTGPVAFMLGMIGCSALLLVLITPDFIQKSDELFIHEEGLKALNKPFFSRTPEENDLEIAQTIELYKMQTEHALYEDHWHHPLPC